MSDVILVGMPGSGKTAVGRHLARITGRQFLDLDERFEERTGAPPAAFLADRGEREFRRIEAEIARESAQLRNAVISTGGGAVIDPISRWELWHAGPVVWLDPPVEALAARLRGRSNGGSGAGSGSGSGSARWAGDGPAGRYGDGPGDGPTGGPDVEWLHRRRLDRAPFYAGADLTLREDVPPETAAHTIAEWLRSHGERIPAARTLLDARVGRHHPIGPESARIMIGSRFDRGALAGLVAGYSRGTPVVVADENVAALQPGLVDAFPSGRRLTIDAGEQNKRLASAEAQLEFAFSHRAERGDAWVAIGGGTTGDLVGVAAALYMRGAPLVQVPTTWLAMADAAIGGKVAVDLAEAKNSAGAFWPPVAVVADIAAIDTLPWERRLDGIAECLKSGIISDPWLWELVARRGVSAMAEGEDADLAARYAIVERTAWDKVSVVEEDPFEHGARRALNLGHTIGHALEIESGYRLPHGRAVVLGIRAVAHVAVARGLLDPTVSGEIDDVVSRLGFSTHRSFDPAAVMRALTGDKKSEGGRIRWILPTAIGATVEANDVTTDEVEAALSHIQQG